MNKLIVTAAVLLALLLGMPSVLGSLTEARVRERVAAIDAGGLLSAEVISFDRGWFGSAAKIELGFAPGYLAQMAGLGAIGADPEFFAGRAPIAVDFAHGPVAVLDGIHLGWSRMVARLDTDAPGVTALQQQLGVPHLFEFRGRTGFSGRLTFDADMPPIDLPIDAARFTFSGARLEGTVAGSALAVNAHVGALDFSSPTGTFAVSNLRATADNTILSQYVLPGEAEFSIERVAISDALRGTAPVFEANNFRVTSDVDIDSAGALMDVQVRYGLDSVRVEETEVTAATVQLVMRNVDVAAVEAYTTATRELAGTAGDPEAVLASLASQIERALAAGPSVTLDPISVRVDGEPLDGRVEVTTNTARLPPAGLLDLDNPLLLMGLLNSNAELRVSKALGQRLAALASRMQLGSDGSMPPDQLDYMAEAQAGLLIVTLVGQGVLIEEGDDYRTAVSFTDGALTLNGNPLPFGLP